MREISKTSSTKLVDESSGGQANCLGYGHNLEDVTMSDPQPSLYGEKSLLGTVQRLDGGGSDEFIIRLKV